jgi:hypothetical protein
MTKRFSCGFSLRLSVELDNYPVELDEFTLAYDKCSLISADTTVWPVPKDVDNLIQDAKQDFWNPLGLSKDLDMLLRACRERNIPVSHLFPVCLTVSEEVLAALVERTGPGYFENSPSENNLLSTGWRFLGFDTTELNGLISGLKSFGYEEPSWSQYRERFGGALNEVGLFSDEVIAAEFANVRGLEIPSHAPFDVVGILIHDPISQ